MKKRNKSAFGSWNTIGNLGVATMGVSSTLERTESFGFVTSHGLLFLRLLDLC